MRVRRSIIISFLNSNMNTVVMFLVSLFLARLLTPAQIGAFSLGVVVINLAAVFRDLGAQTYVVQKQGLRPEDTASALGLMLCMAFVLGAGLWWSAPLAAEYFGQADVQSVIRILTLSFLLVPLSGVLSALLMRGLQAEKSAIVFSISTLAFCATALTLATNGFGAATLAWANLANVLTNLLGFLYFREKGHLRCPSVKGWRPVLRYGGGIVANNLANVANQSAPDLVIGRLVGGHAVGVYSRANGLVSLFQQAVAPMLNYNVMPYVAHGGHRPREVARQLAKAGEYLSVTAWPVYAFLIVFAEPVLGLLYGSQWLEAAPLVALLCLAGVLKSPFMHLMLALQAIDRSWHAALPSTGALVARIVAVLLVRPSDLVTLTWCLLLGEVVSTLLTLHLARRYLHLGYGGLIGQQWRSAFVGLGCLATCWSVDQASLAGSDRADMLLALPIVALVWSGLVLACRHPINLELMAIARGIRARLPQ